MKCIKNKQRNSLAQSIKYEQTYQIDSWFYYRRLKNGRASKWFFIKYNYVTREKSSTMIMKYLKPNVELTEQGP